MHEQVEESMGTCPVCRKVFHSKDIEHVLDLFEAYSELVCLLTHNLQANFRKQIIGLLNDVT